MLFLGDTRSALEWTHKLLAVDPKHSRAKGNIPHYQKSIAEEEQRLRKERRGVRTINLLTDETRLVHKRRRNFHLCVFSTCVCTLWNRLLFIPLVRSRVLISNLRTDEVTKYWNKLETMFHFWQSSLLKSILVRRGEACMATDFFLNIFNTSNTQIYKGSGYIWQFLKLCIFLTSIKKTIRNFSFYIGQYYRFPFTCVTTS